MKDIERTGAGTGGDRNERIKRKSRGRNKGEALRNRCDRCAAAVKN